MFGRISVCAFAVTVFAGFAAGVSAASGYLPAVGPTALRYRPLPQIVTNVAKMPLPAPEPPPAITNVAPTPVALPPTNTPPPPTNTTQVNAAAPAPLPDQDMNFPATSPKYSAQMLMKYFNRSTNGTGTGIIAPVDFAPPPVNSTPPSTATYSTGPK